MIRHRFGWHLLWGFLLVSPLPMAILAWVYIHQFEATLQETTFNSLAAIADKKMGQIRSYMEQRRLDARGLASLPQTREMLKVMGQSFLEPLSNRTIYREFFSAYAENAGYYDLLLTNHLGNVVFSLAGEADLGSNLETGPWRDTVLVKTHREVMKIHEARISDFRPYPPSNRPAAFIVAPIFQDKQVLGTLALQLDLQNFLKEATDATGLGKSGETVLAQRVDDDILYMVPLRHVPDAAFNLKIPLSRSATPMQKALQGEHSQGIDHDYADYEVVANWRYLPELRWGMVVKVNSDEAFAPAHDLRRFSMALLGASLLAAALAAYFLGRAIVSPLHRLTRISQNIAAGNLEQRAPVQGFSESRDLATAFNDMAAHLLEARETLENRVESRTRELEQANRHLQELYTLQQAILDHAGHAIIAVDPGGLITVFNHAAERMLGYEAGEMIGRRTPASFHDAREMRLRAEALSAELGETIPPDLEVFTAKAKRNLPNEAEWVYVRRDGSRFPVLLTVSVLRDRQGEITGYLGLSVDISKRKEDEEKLRLLNRELEQFSRQATELASRAEAASQAKGRFLATMSHEIRTPLNAIIGLSQLVLETDLSPRQKDYLLKVHTSSKALLGILNDILDYSKIEAGHLTLESIPFRVEEPLEQVANLFGARIAEKGLELFLEIAPDVPRSIRGDPLRLTQVLNNLVGNAVKFTDAGEIHLKVTRLEQQADRLRLRIEVRDTGCGLSPEQEERLFQPFTQGDGSTSRLHGGTGLGLAICRHLVEAMGGELRVSGTPGEGSVFYFTLEAGVVVAENDTETAALQGRRVLVVDDQETARLILCQLLESHHLKADSAASGEEALTRLLADTAPAFDFLLVDWRLPGMNGLELIGRIGEAVSLGKLAARPGLLLMTAFDRELLQSEYPALPVDAFLTKPVTPSALFEALRNLSDPEKSHPFNPAEQNAAPSVDFRGRRLLLVEDNPLNQQVAREFLERLGWRVEVTNHGAEALAWLEDNTCDAVLMDMQMPVMDGLEATRNLRKRPQCLKLPVIAMTAAVLPEDRRLCQEAGMNDFVAKPIDPEELVRVLSTWIGASGPEPAASGREPLLPRHLPGFDADRALRLLGRDEALLVRLLTVFRAEQNTVAERLAAWLDQGERQPALALLHALKGQAGNLGLMALSQAAAALEAGLRENRGDLQVFVTTLGETLKALDLFLPVISSPVTPSAADPGRMGALLTRLEPYLKEQELVPEELMHTLRLLVAGVAPHHPLVGLQKALDRFDHTGALFFLQQAMALPSEAPPA
ncbi:MAG: response regulator [Magnetococcales bacterium]|nr:response regulator [Magnetococcales bacterium]